MTPEYHPSFDFFIKILTLKINSLYLYYKNKKTSMKTFIIFITLCLSFTFNSYSQLVVNEVKTITIWKNKDAFWPLSLECSISGEDTVYTFFYRNYNYTQITDIDHITFSNKDEVLQSIELWSRDLTKNDMITTNLFSVTSQGSKANRIIIDNGSSYFRYTKDKTEEIKNLLLNFK